MSLWPRKPNPIRAVGLSAQGVAWRQNGQLRTADHAAGLSALGEAIGSGRIEIVAAPDAAVHWLQPAAQGVASLTELRRIAAARCAQLHGGLPDAWQLAGDWRASAAFPCFAISRSLIQDIAGRLARWQIEARWHDAWALAIEARADECPRTGWSVMRSATRMILWHCTDGLIDALASLAVHPCDDRATAVAKAGHRIRLEQARRPGLAGEVHWMPFAGFGNEAEFALGLSPHLEKYQ